MNGILNVNKPRGFTSFDIVAAVKRFTGEHRVGHAGTLDPMASGVLPVCLGQGTRVVQYLHDSVKTYLAEINLGISTDTQDAEGRVIKQTGAAGITLTGIESVLPLFKGDIQQSPPAYSAVKYKGKPLYKYAREGVTIEAKSRQVSVSRLEITGWQNPVLSLKVACGKGTYIRSLANDIGEKLGCGGSLKSLVRTSYGPLRIEDSHTLEEIKDVFTLSLKLQTSSSNIPGFLLPIDTSLQHLPAIILNEEDARKILCGNVISFSNYKLQITNYRICRAYSAGCFIAILKYVEEESWRPEKVFNENTAK